MKADQAGGQGPDTPGMDHADEGMTCGCRVDRAGERQAQAASAWLDTIRWDAQGLVPAIAQDAASHRVLMMAWMNREALAETVRTGHAVYWSRSRGRLWRKGEESGNRQRVHEIRTDCDADVILLFIDQVGGVACHTGRESCFFRRLEAVSGAAELASTDGASSAAGHVWHDVDPVLVDPDRLYGASSPGHTPS